MVMFAIVPEVYRVANLTKLQRNVQSLRDCLYLTVGMSISARGQQVLVDFADNSSVAYDLSLRNNYTYKCIYICMYVYKNFP